MAWVWAIGLALVCGPLVWGEARAEEAAAATEEMDIYLLIGQSNMAGRGPITDDVRAPLERVFLFTGKPDNEWVPARNPLNIHSTIHRGAGMQKVGPGYGFARRMAEAQPAARIGLVVNARGGTAIAEWMPGTPFFADAVARTRQAAAHGRVRGILWHQGEGDIGRAGTYLDSLATLIAALRQELNAPELPFVAGQLSEDVPVRKPFNTMLLALPEKVPFTAVVRSDGTRAFDRTHFDTPSQLLLGERYAEEMLKLTAPAE